MEIPWLTYESLIWLMANDKGSKTMFEWGAGASTSFFKRFYEVESIEHDKEWAERTGANFEFLESEAYIHPLTKNYDIIVVDGRRRVECFKHALGHFNNFLILDNSERPRYAEAHEAAKHLKRHDFMGYGRRNPYKMGKTGHWQTTIYEKI